MRVHQTLEATPEERAKTNHTQTTTQPYTPTNMSIGWCTYCFVPFPPSHLFPCTARLRCVSPTETQPQFCRSNSGRLTDSSGNKKENKKNRPHQSHANQSQRKRIQHSKQHIQQNTSPPLPSFSVPPLPFRCLSVPLCCCVLFLSLRVARRFRHLREFSVSPIDDQHGSDKQHNIRQ